MLPLNQNSHVIILEIRAGAGGDEAGLFAGELARMYSRFALQRGWKCTELSRSEGGLGNIKDVSLRISGLGVQTALKNETGVHRVQRVPKTEKSGRIHTSTVTIAVLPAVSPVQLNINPGDIKMDTYRSSSQGGQNVQKVETAVRLTHVPTGVIVACQTERSQHQNRERAMEVLSSRLFEMMKKQQKSKVDELRRDQVGTGDRSEKIRTYNFPQDRLTDHRLNKSFHHLEEIMDGHLDPVLDSF